MLPTEDSFKRLTSLQKHFLYLGWTELPSSEQIKEFYDKKSGDPVVDEEAESNFKKLGYSPSQIKRMREQLENAGYSQSN